jgi:hypothetical protein
MPPGLHRKQRLWRLNMLAHRSHPVPAVKYLYRGPINAAWLTKGHKCHVRHEQACSIDVIRHTCALTSRSDVPETEALPPAHDVRQSPDPDRCGRLQHTLQAGAYGSP